MKWECQAYSVTTRTFTRYSGCDPPNRSCANSVSLVASWARKSSFSVAKCSGVIGLLDLPHQMVLSVSASQTVNLSFAERPVCLPVSTTSGPSFDSRSEEHTSELQSLMRISYAVF